MPKMEANTNFQSLTALFPTMEVLLPVECNPQYVPEYIRVFKNW